MRSIMRTVVGTSRHYGKNTSGGTGYYIERAF